MKQAIAYVRGKQVAVTMNNKDIANQLQEYLHYSQIITKQIRQQVNEEAVASGSPQQRHFIFEKIKKVIVFWHDEILQIYKKVGDMPIKNDQQVVLVRQTISDYVCKNTGLKHYQSIDGATISQEDNEILLYIMDQYIQVEVALNEGHNGLINKVRKEKTERFRFYFALLLGIGGTLLGVLLGALFTP